LPPVRIAITHPYSWPEVRRGAERIIVETSRALADRGHDVTVFTSGSSAGRVTEGGVLTVTYRRQFDDPFRHERWFGWRVLPDLVLHRYDAVHSMMPHDCCAAMAASRVRHHRTLYDEMGNPFGDKVRQRKDGRARQRVIAGVDVYACMSEFSRGLLRRDWHREGAIVPGGVATGEFQPLPRSDAPTILFSGAIDRPEKHVPLLLDAVALLAGERPDVRLQLSGPGDPSPLLAAAPAAARERTDVLGLGDADGQSARYATAWSTCLPTTTDSFGLVLLESLAAGTPIVVGNDGAPPALVQPGIGAACREMTADDLAAALATGLDLAADPETAARCRAVALEYDWDQAIAPILEGLYAGTERDQPAVGGDHAAR
jgi:phosphatidylinositol alpha-mannosyltransferase